MWCHSVEESPNEPDKSLFFMTTSEAKFILTAVRAGQSDSSDPVVAEALRLAALDPELGEWLDRSTALDAVVSGKLREIVPPADLESSILAGLKVSRQPASRRPASRRPPSRRPLAYFLVAAAALVMIGLVIYSVLPVSPQTSSGSPARESLAEFRSVMLREIGELKELDYHSDDPQDVSAWLDEHGATPVLEIPASADGHALVGCKVIHWKGHRVSLVCFSRPGAGGPPGLHLLSIPAEAIKTFDETSASRHVENDWTTTSWREGGFIHVLAARGEHDSSPPRLPLG